MKVEKDFVDLLRLFDRNRVKYCVIGAYALAFYATPRYTKDLDILVEPSINNSKKIIKSLVEFGFGSLNLSAKDFSRKCTIVQLGYEPVRIDLITSIAGVSFRKVWQNKGLGKFGRQKFFIIGLNELIANKKATRRKQDLIDLKTLLHSRTKKR